MKTLLFKEFKLATHPTIYIFLAIGLLLLIPSYIYYAAFIYTCLSVFFLFLAARENKDVLFTVSLPIRKRDAVRARCLMVAIVELAQTLVAVPFAIIGIRINPNSAGNLAGIEANMAFFGLVLIMFAIFNAIFLPEFYKTATKVGGPLIISSIALAIYVTVAEVAVQKVPYLKAHLDTTSPAMAIYQLPVLILGMAIFALSLWLTYKKSAANFEKVDL
jgi:ABC-2 family transporter protein